MLSIVYGRHTAGMLQANFTLGLIGSLCEAAAAGPLKKGIKPCKPGLYTHMHQCMASLFTERG